MMAGAATSTKGGRGPGLDLALLALLGFAFLDGSPARLGLNRSGEPPLDFDLRPLVPLGFLAWSAYRTGSISTRTNDRLPKPDDDGKPTDPGTSAPVTPNSDRFKVVPPNPYAGEDVTLMGLRETEYSPQIHLDTKDGRRLKVRGTVVEIPDDTKEGPHTILVVDKPSTGVNTTRGKAPVTVQGGKPATARQRS